MKRIIKVSSSVIDKLGYDNKKLYIQFSSGSSYVYRDVDESVFEKLATSDSIGRCYNNTVRGEYESSRLGYIDLQDIR